MAASPELSDAELLRKIVRRDESALALLYDRHSRLVYSVALRVLRSATDAEEILQETFVRVWSRAETYEVTRGSLAAWLTTIARNRAIDRVRAQAVRKDVDAGPALEPAVRPLTASNSDPGPSVEPVTHLTPDVVLQETTTASVVRRALGTLPDAQRTLIEAAFFDGYTHSELSERFGVPLGTVKARIRTGLLALRSQLAQAV